MPKIRNLMIAFVIGLMAGLFSSAFLYSLEFVTSARLNDPRFIWALPIFGLISAFVLRKLPRHIQQGVPYLLKEIENEKAPVSPLMAPFVFISALGTHLFGGSAGREGVGIIMGASLSQLFSIKNNRLFLLYGGMAAGFSSIFGTPLAAILFAFEIQSFKHARNVELIIFTSISSFSSLIIPHYLGPGHEAYSVSFSYEYKTFFYVFLAAITSGIGANLFYWGLHFYSALLIRIFRRNEIRYFAGGIFITSIVFLFDSFDSVGIGTHLIRESFNQEMGLIDFGMKAILTIMTLGVGFKGGEVTPLFIMGATFSNSMAVLFGLKNFALSSSLGWVGLFGAVTGSPIASAVMGAELFGVEVGLLCLGTCFVSRWLMRGKSVYRL